MQLGLFLTEKGRWLKYCLRVFWKHY